MDGIDSNLVIKLYTEGKSTREVASCCGTNHRRIQRILEGCGIPRRDRYAALQKYVRWNICVVCGEKFRAKENWKSTRNPYRKTCSKECQYIHQSKSLSHDVGHSQAYYQKRRREFYPDVCMDCGSTTLRIDTHHKDRNKSNNSKENLMCLCLKCHAKIHYNEDKIFGRFKRPSKKQKDNDSSVRTMSPEGITP
jgi:hypothetical protein